MSIYLWHALCLVKLREVKIKKQGGEYMRNLIFSAFAFTMLLGSTPAQSMETENLELQSTDAYSYVDVYDVRCNARRCHATLEWMSDNYYGDIGVVTVQRDGGPEKLVGCNNYNMRRINWIVRGSHYVFRLYQTRRCPLNKFPSKHQLGYAIDQASVRY